MPVDVCAARPPERVHKCLPPFALCLYNAAAIVHMRRMLTAQSRRIDALRATTIMHTWLQGLYKLRAFSRLAAEHKHMLTAAMI